MISGHHANRTHLCPSWYIHVDDWVLETMYQDVVVCCRKLLQGKDRFGRQAKDTQAERWWVAVFTKLQHQSCPQKMKQSLWPYNTFAGLCWENPANCHALPCNVWLLFSLLCHYACFGVDCSVLLDKCDHPAALWWLDFDVKRHGARPAACFGTAVTDMEGAIWG